MPSSHLPDRHNLTSNQHYVKEAAGMEVGTGSAALLLEAWTPPSEEGLLDTGIGVDVVEVAGRPLHSPSYPPSAVVLFFSVYLLGVLGNLAALLYLYGSKSKPRNPKHALMLRCLAANDLVAVLGMWGQFILQQYWPSMSKTIPFCGFRAVWRIFGLGSGCVVIVMAIERWFALTRPFFYQKHVTLSTIRRSILFLWGTVLILVCLPFFGFGIYFKRLENDTIKCIRYKSATDPVDKAYAYLYLTFGAMLCICLVWCNVCVMRALVMTRQGVKRQAVLVRRISRNRDLTASSSTSEEVAFAKIMALLCIVFVICWLPQLASIPVAQLYPSTPFGKVYLRLADLFLALHFIVDPYFYILQRWPCIRSLCRKRHHSRANSMKTSHELCSL